jgi:hypothetical protein
MLPSRCGSATLYHRVGIQGVMNSHSAMTTATGIMRIADCISHENKR